MFLDLEDPKSLERIQIYFLRLVGREICVFKNLKEKKIAPSFKTRNGGGRCCSKNIQRHLSTAHPGHRL